METYENMEEKENMPENGAVPQIIKAMEHDLSDALIAEPKTVLDTIEGGVVGAYKAVETGVVGAYKAVETGAVNAYRKVEDTMVDKLFRKEGETVEDAKKRLQGMSEQK